MKKSFLKSALLMLSLLIFADGCVPSKPTEEEKILPADRLIKKLEGNRRKVKTFIGTGVVNIESPAFSAKGNFEVILKKPDSIKISIYGPFGIDVGHALVTKYDFKFYDVLRGKLYIGENDRSILKDLLKIDIEFDDMMDGFAGAVNLTDKLKEVPDKFDQSEDLYELTYIDSTRNIKSYFVVDKENLAIRKYVLFNMQNDELFVGDYSNFREYDEVPVPYTTTVTNIPQSQKLLVEYRNIKVNQRIEKLEIVVPSDVEVVQW